MIKRSSHIFPILETAAKELSETVELYKIVHAGMSDEEIAKVKSAAFEIMTYVKIIREIDERKFDEIPF